MIRNPGSAYVEFKDLQHAPDQHHVINKEAWVNNKTIRRGSGNYLYETTISPKTLFYD